MLGQRIYELRTARGWSQVQLAEKLSITKQTVSNWENDNIQPSIEMLILILTVASPAEIPFIEKSRLPGLLIETTPVLLDTAVTLSFTPISLYAA